MKNEYIKLVETTLKENPSLMQIGNNFGDMEEKSSITFGFFENVLYSVSNREVSINGVVLTEKHMQSMTELLTYACKGNDFKLNLEEFLDIPDHRVSSYHYKLAKIAKFVSIYNKVKTTIDVNPNIDEKELYEKFGLIVEKYDNLLDNPTEGRFNEISRDGLSPAGRIFPSVKGISFYNPTSVKSDNSIVDVIFTKLSIPEKESYTIEYQEQKGGSYTQRPYRKNEVSAIPTNQRELSDKEQADELLARYAASERAKDRKLRAKDGKSKYHSYGPNKGD